MAAPPGMDGLPILKTIPLTIKITSQQEPLVGGLGWGLRSRVLGYFVRTDWAWGYENGEFQPRMFYLSLNLDF